MVAKTIVREQLKELDKLIAASEKLDRKKQDYEGAPTALSVNAKGKWTHSKPADLFGVPGGFIRETGMQMERNALFQLLGRLSVPFFGKGNGTTMDSADWQTLAQKYPKQFAEIVNDLLPQVESKGLLIRAHGKDIRAVLTDKYGVVDNTAVMTGIREILVETAKDLQDLRIVNSVVDRDRLDLRVVFSEPKTNNPNDPTAQGETRRHDPRGGQPYGLGAFVTNEETGRGGLAVKALVWRGQCTNSIIVNTAQTVNLRHIGQTNVLLGRMQQAFADALPVAAQTLNRVYEVSNKALPNLTDVLSGLAKQYNWSEETSKQVLIGTEGQETVLGLVNGVSYAASKLETSADQVEMETQAGAILVAPESLFARAARVAVEARR